MEVLWIILVMAFAALVIVAILQSVRLIPQAHARNVERLGRFRRTLGPGMHALVPFADRLRPMIDLRERVLTMREPVITRDSVDVTIDVVLFFRVGGESGVEGGGGQRWRRFWSLLRAWADVPHWGSSWRRYRGAVALRRVQDMTRPPYKAQYKIQNYVRAIEKLTGTELRNLVATMPIEQLLVSRGSINASLPAALNQTARDWGLTVTRVEVMTVELPPAIAAAMEERQGEILRAQSEARAIRKVATAVGGPSQPPSRVLFELLRGLLGSRWVQDGADQDARRSHPADG